MMKIYPYLRIVVPSSNKFMEQLVEFNKIIGDLENIKLRLEDVGALMVWCCLENEEGDMSHL